MSWSYYVSGTFSNDKCVDCANEAKVLHLIKSSSSFYIMLHHTLGFKNGSHWLKKQK